jgi:hypothetical protein
LQKLLCWYCQNDLPLLARICKTDKWGVHRYALHYQVHFERLRRRPLNILEIGVGGYENPQRGGDSLRMWKAFFPRGRIFGIDKYDKSIHDEPRIRTFRGSQDDPRFLEEVARTIGRLDVVIDDGSHVNSHVVTTFNVLFPRLAADGIYVIEDLQTAYWPDYGGSEDPSDESTSIAMVKRLVDGLNWEEFAHRPEAPFDRLITAVHLYHNLVFIDKGHNEEGSIRRFDSPSDDEITTLL